MTIVNNRKALHEYFVEETIMAGVKLEGWEVKAIRAGRVQLQEAYVIARDNEIFLIGCHISPLINASTHVATDPVRSRKLLLTAHQIIRLTAKVKVAGFTMTPLNLDWLNGKVKCKIGVAKGKKQHDKREASKDRDVAREIAQAMKTAAH